MRAEHLLFFLDEIDELRVYLREAGQPGFLAVCAVVALCAMVAAVTRSAALGIASLVLLTWAGLAAAMALQRLRQPALQPVPVHSPKRPRTVR